MTDLVLCRRFPFPDVNELVARGRPDGVTLRWLANDATPAAARAALAGVDVLMGAWVTGWPFAAGDFPASLRLVQLLSSGYESVDVATLAAAGIPVANIGAANASTVAEHAMALILALLRQLPAQVDLVRGGGWRPAPPARELRGKTVGIVGLGGIGTELARRALAFDTTVRYTSRHRMAAAEAALGVAWAPLGELLATSDVLCLAVPVTPETTGLIGAAELAVMRPSAILVNVSRGAVVDEPALAKALAGGMIAGAGLDVLAAEPPAPDNPLLALPNVLVTPHQAGLSPDAWPRIVTLAWANVVSALAGGEIAHRIG
ncbi:MAG TPA: NAD(P)-dependent oxidoreductase [Pseudonocardiaceae bacterium]|nr:NAD(P)-dependent oxidoreductase [Pseudonocardiaceae bacterium]